MKTWAYALYFKNYYPEIPCIFHVIPLLRGSHRCNLHDVFWKYEIGGVQQSYIYDLRTTLYMMTNPLGGVEATDKATAFCTRQMFFYKCVSLPFLCHASDNSCPFSCELTRPYADMHRQHPGKARFVPKKWNSVVLKLARMDISRV